MSAWWHHCSTNKSQCLGQRTTTVVGIHKAGGNYHSGERCHWWKRLSMVARQSIWWTYRWWRKTHSPFKQNSRKATSAGNFPYFAMHFHIEIQFLCCSPEANNHLFMPLQFVLGSKWDGRKNARHQANCEDHFEPFFVDQFDLCLGDTWEHNEK